MNFWSRFEERSPKAAQWIREGGLFIIISNLITVFKYLILQFLPKLFVGLPLIDFGFPGVDVTLFGVTFKWYIIGYGANQGGLPYFCAYMIAMFIGEVINFFLQRNVTFRSKGNLAVQGLVYLIAFCVVTCVVNSINCAWIAVAADNPVFSIPDFIYNILTVVLNGGVSMVVFFFVNKWIFSDGEATKKEA